MLCICLLFCFFFLLASAQDGTSTNTLQSLACQLATIYQKPNASAAYPVPAVQIKDSSSQNLTLESSSSKDWTLTNVLGQSSDVYAIDHHQILEQAVFLDTSATLQNTSSAATLGLAGCSLYFSLPSAHLSNDKSGSCATVLDKDCVKDFTKVAVDAATAISRNADPNLTPAQACTNISDSMKQLPKSCAKFRQDGSNSIGKGLLAFSTLNLSPPTSPRPQNCSGFPVSDQLVPTNIFSQSYAMPNATNYTLYDEFVRSTTPMLLTFFSNASSGVKYSEPFADAHLVCSAPRDAQAGSRTPEKSAAEPVKGNVDGSRVFLWVFLVNAICFAML